LSDVKGKHVPEFLHEGGTETQAARVYTKSGSPDLALFLRVHDHHVRADGTVLYYPLGTVRADRHCRENARGRPVWSLFVRQFRVVSLTAGPGADIFDPARWNGSRACRPLRDRKGVVLKGDATLPAPSFIFCRVSRKQKRPG
jgi:hypothetical protein